MLESQSVLTRDVKTWYMMHIVNRLRYYTGRFSFVTGTIRYVKEDCKLFPVHLRPIDISEWIIDA